MDDLGSGANKGATTTHRVFEKDLIIDELSSNSGSEVKISDLGFKVDSKSKAM